MTAKPFTIFVVEDNEWYNKLLVYNLSLDPDYVVKGFSSASSFLAAIGEKPDVVTIDYRLPDMDGLELLGKIRQQLPEAEVIAISEQENIETAVSLLRSGAYDYIVKTKDIRELLLNTVRHIRRNRSLEERIVTLEKEVQRKYEFSNTLIGKSPAMQKVFVLLEKALTANITVSITGETGTGKELVAKAIHYNSARKQKPFVAVNVTAIPADLIESELFGHEKGAFTGATARRTGKFEEADGGTLFLDEIGDMSLVVQAKLLRVLQEREVVRIGGNNTVKVDCRIIVATHRNLQEEVKAGRFREDLYYRLFGLTIDLPPLRTREQDILLLAKYFIDGFCKDNAIAPKYLEERAQQKLMGYRFPGNVRELRSVVELAVVMSNDNAINADDISLSTFDAVSEITAVEQSMREYELQILQLYLSRYNNNIRLVAEKLKIGQATIYRMLKEKGQSAD